MKSILMPVWAFVILAIFAVIGAISIGVAIYTIHSEKFKD
jgi:hypothetical protein